MHVIFFDSDDDEGRWEFDLPSAPREGERVMLPDRKMMVVARVTWGFDEDEPYIEVIVRRVTLNRPA